MKLLKRPFRSDSPWLRVEMEYGQSTEEVLRAFYVDKKLTMEQIGEILGIRYETIYRTIRKMGLYRNGIKL